jgi:hypothetical protein
MTDEQLSITEECAKEYAQTPSDRPFDKRMHDFLAQLIKSGVDRSEAKRLLRYAATPQDHRDYIRPDAHESVGDLLTTKEASISFLFC